MEVLRFSAAAQSSIRISSFSQRTPFKNSAISQLSSMPTRSRPSYASSFRRGLTNTAETRRIDWFVAAAFSGKGHKFDRKKNVYNFNSSTQHPPRPQESSDTKVPGAKRPDSGQDAYFISKVGGSEAVAFGVADGVGGWEGSGIDPADFAHGFCNYMAESVRESKSSEGLTARGLMETGYKKITSDKSIIGGGSTACVAVGRENGILEVANLGDSGFIHLRANAVHQLSEPQTHAFNTPYQLSLIPQKLRAQAAVFGGGPLHDLPKDATLTQLDVKHGDVLVFATDGVWDNTGAQDILKTVSRFMTKFHAWQPMPPQGMKSSARLHELVQPGFTEQHNGHTLQSLIAAAITAEAKSASMNTKRNGPFAKEVQKYYPEERYSGGKVDDICVLVVMAVRKKER